MKYSLGFSPCPNDTFIFDGWVNGKINSSISVDPVLEDVETLNEWAAAQRLDITKLSYPALFRNLDKYRLLPTGSALGYGVGPLLIAREPIDPNDPTLQNKKILLPGRTTTANLLFSYAFPKATNKSYCIFSEIEQAVLIGEADLGVIIHENRFTYAQKGLHLVCDLGAHWEKHTGCAIPLGCIAAKRSLGTEMANEITRYIQSSLQFAWNHLPSLPTYAIRHAQEMEEFVMRQHIDLYVNKHSLNLDQSDIRSIETFYKIYCEIEGLSQTSMPSFF